MVGNKKKLYGGSNLAGVLFSLQIHKPQRTKAPRPSEYIKAILVSVVGVRRKGGLESIGVWPALHKTSTKSAFNRFGVRVLTDSPPRQTGSS
jgi:hypothetical protein